MWRSVILRPSLPPPRRTPGSQRSTVSRLSLPSPTSWSTRVAVKVLEAPPIRTGDSAEAVRNHRCRALPLRTQVRSPSCQSSARTPMAADIAQRVRGALEVGRGGAFAGVAGLGGSGAAGVGHWQGQGGRRGQERRTDHPRTRAYEPRSLPFLSCTAQPLPHRRRTRWRQPQNVCEGQPPFNGGEFSPCPGTPRALRPAGRPAPYTARGTPEGSDRRRPTRSPRAWPRR